MTAEVIRLRTPEQEVRERFPDWDDATVRRHLEQREHLCRVAQQQRREREWASAQAAASQDRA